VDEKSIFREKSEANSHSQKVKISLETLEFRVTYKNIPNIPYSEAGGIQKIGIFTCTSIPVFQFNFHENFTPTIPGQSWGVNVGIKRGPFNSLNIFETSPPLKVQLSSSSKKKTSYQCSTPSFHSYRCWW